MRKTNRFVFDTNTLISAFLIKNSVSFNALSHSRSSGKLLFSENTFLEFELVLLRRKFDKYFSEDERYRIINVLENEGVFIPIKSDINICRDPKDNQFLNLAIDGNASIIITGDKDLLILNPYKHIPIMSPSGFLSTFNNNPFMVNEPQPEYSKQNQ